MLEILLIMLVLAIIVLQLCFPTHLAMLKIMLTQAAYYSYTLRLDRYTITLPWMRYTHLYVDVNE